MKRYCSSDSFCNGDVYEYKLCDDLPPCGFSLRARQCESELKSLTRHTWEEDHETEVTDSCRINCRTSGNYSEVYHWAVVASDGIPCSNGWRNGLCIRQKCHYASCDKFLRPITSETGFQRLFCSTFCHKYQLTVVLYNLESEFSHEKCGRCNNDTICIGSAGKNHMSECNNQMILPEIPRGSYHFLL